MQTCIWVENRQSQEEATVNDTQCSPFGSVLLILVSANKKNKQTNKKTNNPRFCLNCSQDPYWNRSRGVPFDLILQNIKKVKTYPPRTMMELAPEKFRTWGGTRRKVLTVTLSSFLCICPPSEWVWSFYQVFCKKSIVPCHASDECFLSLAQPKWTNLTLKAWTVTT